MLLWGTDACARIVSVCASLNSQPEEDALPAWINEPTSTLRATMVPENGAVTRWNDFSLLETAQVGFRSRVVGLAGLVHSALLIDLLRRDGVFLEQRRISFRGNASQFEVGFDLRARSMGLIEFAVDFRRVDFGEDLSGLDRVADVYHASA